MRCSAVGAMLLLGPTVAAFGQRAGVPYQFFTPSRCAMVPGLAEQFADRQGHDPAAFTPASDTLRRTTIDAALACDGVYGGLTSDERQLLDLARVKLAAGADSVAASLQRRYLEHLADAPARERAWALYLITSDNLAARPPRLALARRAVTALDALVSASGPSDSVARAGATRAQILAHQALAQAALRAWDDSAARAESRRAIDLWKQIPDSGRRSLTVPVALAYLLLAEVELRTVGIDSARAVIDSANRFIPPGAPGNWYVATTRTMYAVLGKPAAPVEARFWFNTGGDSTPRPARGRVSIISGVSHYCGMSCRGRYDAMARYQSRFGARGLDLINVTRTFGFYVDTAPVSPEQEARYDSVYFRSELRVPGMLAVAETKYSWLPDGRRADDPTAQEGHYPFATFVIVDKSGLVRYVAFDWDPILEEPLARLIEGLLDEPG
jgi:hypothetical protein